MSNLVHNKVVEFRRQADACESWAATVDYPDIKQALLEIAQEWRDMADRFERIHFTLPMDDGA